MQLTVWINKTTKVFMGGDPDKGQVPFVSLELKKAQVIVDQEKQTIKIVEDSGQ